MSTLTSVKLGRTALAALLLVGALGACSRTSDPSSGTSCTGETQAGGAITEFSANSTPPREVPGGMLRLRAASSTGASFSRVPGDEVSVSVGESFELGSVNYTLVGACSVDHGGERLPPGSTTGKAYLRQG